MIKRDRIIIGFVVFQMVVFGGAAAVRMVRAMGPAHVHDAVTLSAKASEIVDDGRGFLGDASSPVTLVEFGEYECPPCARSHEKVASVLRRHTGKVRFQFRHFPVSKKHPYALEASVAAEAARAEGKFWEVHGALFAHGGAIDSDVIARDLRTSGVVASRKGREEALRNVQADMALGQRFSFSFTPTFLACLPDGRVVQLTTLEQIEEYFQ